MRKGWLHEPGDRWAAPAALVGTLLLASAAVAAPPAVKPGTKPAAGPSGTEIVSIRVEPASLSLANKRDVRRVVVIGTTRAGTSMDLTPKASFQVAGGLAAVDAWLRDITGQ